MAEPRRTTSVAQPAAVGGRKAFPVKGQLGDDGRPNPDTPRGDTQEEPLSAIAATDEAQSEMWALGLFGMTMP